MIKTKDFILKIKFIHIASIISLLILLTGVAGVIETGISSSVSPVNFPVTGEKEGRGILYIPDTRDNRPPVVFLLPGIYTPPEGFEMMAMELARRGYVAVSLDFPYQDERRNLKILESAIQYIKDKKVGDNERIAVIAHSLGSYPGVKYAFRDPSVKAVVIMGYYVGGEVQANPGNLLFCTGVHDDLNGPDKVETAFKTFCDETQINHLVKTTQNKEYTMGSFENRTARGVYISPGSNHASEREDYYIMNRIFLWLENSLNHYPFGRGVIYADYVLSLFLIIIGGFLTLSWIGMKFFYKKAPISKWIFLFFLCYFGFLPFLIRASHLFYTIGFLIVFISAITTNYYILKYDNYDEGYNGFIKDFIKFVIILICLLVGFSLSQMLFSTKILMSDIRNIDGFPDYLFISFFLTPWMMIRAGLLILWQFYPAITAIFIIVSIILFILEFREAGFWGKRIASLIDKTNGFIKFEKAEKISPIQKYTALGLLILSLILWFTLCKRVYLTSSILQTYFLFSLRYLFLPLFLWYILSKMTFYIINKIKPLKEKMFPHTGLTSK